MKKIATLLAIALLPGTAAAKKSCTYETLEAFSPGQGELVSVKRATLKGELDPDGYTIFQCEKGEADWECLKRVSEDLMESGTKVEAELAGKILSFVAVFVIDGERFEGEFETRKDVMKNLEYHKKQGKEVVLESVVEKMDPNDRHVVAKLDDANAVKSDAPPKVWMVWDPKAPDMFASLSTLEDATSARGLKLHPGKWRQDGKYEFELSCPE